MAFSNSDGASFDAQPAQDANAVKRISLLLMRKVYNMPM